MATFGRAFKIIALLLGFYVMCLVIIAVLIGLDVLLFNLTDVSQGFGRTLFLLVLVTLGAIYIVIRGVFVSTRPRRKHLPGIPVSAAEQPELWRRVTALAEAAGTRPPHEIRLVQSVNAAVMENTHLFGLLPGKRRMLIGVPLLQGMTVPQFESVIAHELGHYSGRDQRLGPLYARAVHSVLGAQRAVHGTAAKPRRFQIPGNDTFAEIFDGYANIVLVATFAMRRQQELAADRFAAQIGGRRNAAAALREIPAIDAAYDFYLDRYVASGIPLGLVPAPQEVLGGFLGFVNDPRRADEMRDLRDDAPAAEQHKYDSHPPTRDRVAAILALPDDGRPLDESDHRAVGLLRDPAASLAALGVIMLKEHSAGKAVTDWDSLARAVRIEAARKSAAPLVDVVSRLLGRPARVVDLLGFIDAGRFGEILAGVPQSEAAKKVKATGPVAREFAKTIVGRMLSSWTVLELIQTGRIGVRHTWADVAGEIVAPAGLVAALDAGIDGVIALTADTAPLRGALLNTGVRV